MNNQTPKFEKNIPTREYAAGIQTAKEIISKDPKLEKVVEEISETISNHKMNYLEANKALRMVDAALYHETLEKPLN
ncbi:hypothetical protein [Carnobacterium maltaromaticum]|uniref:hypothetical protein n=1 Tax=Carnobacterium maltaromaticum TaxID=2751 RepID=UPI0012FAC367|nr:hypothetical protein [Carnobacterium maltaromaticum]